MKRLFNIPNALWLLSVSSLALAQSNGTQPYPDNLWQDDPIVCQKTVEGVTFIYGFIDGKWQAVERHELDVSDLLDCDEVYEIAPSPVS
jgi:hypothetical protein